MFTFPVVILMDPMIYRQQMVMGLITGIQSSDWHETWHTGALCI